MDGPGGFSNQDMGFTPSIDIFHLMEVNVLATTGQFNIKVTQQNNPLANVYSASFTNPGYTPGDPIGLVTRQSATGKFARFDNFTISSSIPEPTTLVIWSLLATLGLSFYRRRQRTA